MAVYFYLTLGPPQGPIAAGSAQQSTRGFTWRGIVLSGRAKWQRSPGCPSAHWNAFADSASAPSSFALALARSDTSSLTSSRTSTHAALVRPLEASDYGMMPVSTRLVLACAEARLVERLRVLAAKLAAGD